MYSRPIKQLFRTGVIFILVVIICLTIKDIPRLILSIRSNSILQYECASHDNMILIDIEKLMISPQSLEQDDPNLIKKVRDDYLFPPSNLDYSLKRKTDDPSMGQSKAIREILGPMKHGFFIECGALDGETRSNTLVFEKRFGWEGILIDANPKNFDLLIKKRRKAWALPVCLSIFPYPNVVMFQEKFNLGKISNMDINSEKVGYAKVQCLPIYTILLALNRTKVDYFSLDVEGHELEVLRTIPWDKVNITTLSVEFFHGKEGKNVLKSYMLDKGYLVFSEVTHKRRLANDFIFYHPALIPKSMENNIPAPLLEVQ